MQWPAIGGWLGAILGALLGVAGGAFGTWCALRGARGPRERAFLLRATIVLWVVVLGFVTAVMLLPGPYKDLLWAPYILGLLVAIRLLNKQIEQIRREEQHDAEPTQ